MVRVSEDLFQNGTAICSIEYCEVRFQFAFAYNTLPPMRVPDVLPRKLHVAVLVANRSG